MPEKLLLKLQKLLPKANSINIELSKTNYLNQILIEKLKD